MDVELIERVRHVISTAGESQAVVAARIGISPDKLSKSLKGARRFTSLELALIAERGGKTVDWLLRGVEPRTVAGTAARKAAELDHNTADVRTTLSRYERVIDALHGIGYTLPLSPLPESSQIGTGVERGNDLARTATKALPCEPWGRSTRELAADCELAFGVVIATTALPGKLDGLSWSTELFHLILVAQTQMWTRQRFTLAHELGHILARDAYGDAVVEKIQPGRTSDAKEVQANAFAAEFLMPREAILSEAGASPERVDVQRMAWHFKVSPSAMAARLKVLGLLTTAQLREWAATSTADCVHTIDTFDQNMLNAEASNGGWHPRALTRLALTAYSRGDTTARPLAALLGLDPDELLDILEPAPPEPAQTSPMPSGSGTEIAFNP
ncbi:helix-turn-helix domain-containing protein [Kitasatospora sp. NPDC088160]|uniref:helix-turn-helix domain-containing protein n=1 Tax=Kitasatospora sp. NPDC088160 TaxID=3364072 RepID=UPI0038144976